jgi:hypothetical protein
MADGVAAVQKMFSELVQAARQPSRKSWMNCVNWPKHPVRLSPWPTGMCRFGRNGCGNNASNLPTSSCARIFRCPA